MRRDKFVKGGLYHICNKSIANFGIFQNSDNAGRFIRCLNYYNNKPVSLSLSKYEKIHGEYQNTNILLPYDEPESYVKFLSYCIMPDHYHLLVRINIPNLFSNYISNIENSYTRYFNIKFDRKGPLWQSRFRSVQIKTDEQLLHVSRYIHLNPTTNSLVSKPENWEFSSYNSLIANENIFQHITEISIRRRTQYKRFVENQIDYQRKLKEIKKFLLE